MKIGDKVKHRKNKHWGKGEIERLSKSGLSARVIWGERFGLHRAWRNKCRIENLELCAEG
ncbi:hypothetical protein [Paenibacillus lutrae]|uniref:DUF3553 domain-containing protein n=1 Tax=Paenibacillus lutrae TaxID=2078573 RepID=A0A7X3FJC3_9BACL|nr:hypothetical protein [Paenibacillus lutrae]MVP00377.1 hypothetical protein [Paenibacillus lutrae]